MDFVLYEPYGYMLYKSYDNIDEDGAAAYCGILRTNDMPAAINTDSRNFFMYNPGTEMCDTVIRIGGTVGTGGLTITNATNNTKCKLLSLPANGYLEIDSFLGAIVHVNGNTRTLDFQNHDEGYLKLSPSMLIRDVNIQTTNNSPTVTVLDYPVTEALIGKYVQIGHFWRQIQAVDGQTLTLSVNMTSTGGMNVKIATVN